MSILLVTVTSGRPKAFDIFTKVIADQTTKDFQWLVVCDDWHEYKFPTKGIHLIKRDNTDDKLNSMCENWLCALDYIEKNERYDKIIVMEDDDFYHREYVLETAGWLDKCELFGWEQDAYYYVISRKARRTHNVQFAALASTAFTRSVLPYFRKCVELGSVFIDRYLWWGIKETALCASSPMKLENGQVVQPGPVEYQKTVDSFKGKILLADNFTGLPCRQAPQIGWVDGKLNITKVEYELDDDGNIKDEHCRHCGLKEPWHGGKGGASDHSALLGGGPDMWGDRLKKWIGDKQANRYLSLFQDPPGRNGKPYPPFAFVTLPPDTDR